MFKSFGFDVVLVDLTEVFSNNGALYINKY